MLVVTRIRSIISVIKTQDIKGKKTCLKETHSFDIAERDCRGPAGLELRWQVGEASRDLH